MGANSRRRRQARERRRPPQGPSRGRAPRSAGPVDQPQRQSLALPRSKDDGAVSVCGLVLKAALACRSDLADAGHLRRQARSLLFELRPLPGDVVARAADLVVLTLMLGALDRGWDEGDLVELVHRRAAPAGLTCLSDAASLVVRRDSSVQSAGPVETDPVLPPRPGADTVEGMQVLLQVAALLWFLPPLDDVWEWAASAGRRLLWIEPPGIQAKTDLVTAVADAHGCGVVGNETLGCCVVLGEPPDLDAVDEVATSLLVQATTALALQDSGTDGRGVARTASFDRSFLQSYTYRIEERLDLLPMLPTYVQPPVWADPEGWVAGRAAADVAQLDVPEQVTRRR
jgi:hypothetical protein